MGPYLGWPNNKYSPLIRHTMLGFLWTRPIDLLLVNIVVLQGIEIKIKNSIFETIICTRFVLEVSTVVL